MKNIGSVQVVFIYSPFDYFNNLFNMISNVCNFVLYLVNNCFSPCVGLLALLVIVISFMLLFTSVVNNVFSFINLSGKKGAQYLDIAFKVIVGANAVKSLASGGGNNNKDDNKKDDNKKDDSKKDNNQNKGDNSNNESSNSK